MSTGADHERYTIRRKLLKIFGAAFHIYDRSGGVVGYCKQKAFRLREDIRVFTDETMTTPLLVLKTRQVIDFSASYDVLLPDGTALATLRRGGMKSTFLRDAWTIVDDKGVLIGRLEEQGSVTPLVRRYAGDAGALFPQRTELTDAEGRPVATFRTHFNPIVYKLGVAVHEDQHGELDELVILAAACLTAAIEGRQE